MARSWTRERIVQGLVVMHQKGHRLRGEEIKRYDSALHNALYYKKPDGSRYINSLEEARKAVADTLRQQGNEKEARKVLEFNKPLESPNKNSPEENDEIKRRTIQDFRERINAGKDMTFRTIKDEDGNLAHRLRKYVGYMKAFEILGLNPDDYTTRKHDRREYLERLRKEVEGTADLDRTSIERRNPKLTRRLNAIFGGYYKALETLQNQLAKEGKTELADRANPRKWTDDLIGNRKEEAKKRRKIAKDKIRVVDSNLAYNPEDWGIQGRTERITGRDLIKRLEAEGWVSTSRIGEAIQATSGGIAKYLPLRFPEETIIYKEGNRKSYRFDKSVLTRKKKSPRGNTIRGDSPEGVARKLKVKREKIRSIMNNLGLGSQSNNRHISVGEKDTEAIEKVLEREDTTMERILTSVDPRRDYTFTEMEILGIPADYFRKAVREGIIVAGARNRAKTISGEIILDYFATKYDKSHLSQGLRLISHFHNELRTVSDLVPSLKLPRSTIGYRLEQLLRENPEAAFRIRKSQDRSRVLIDSNLIPFVRDWRERAGLQLIAVATSLDKSQEVGLGEIKALVEEAESFVMQDGRLKEEDNIKVFRVLRKIEKYLSKRTEVGGTEIIDARILRICSYMARHGYHTIEIGVPISLEDFRRRVHSPELTRKAESIRKSLEFGLYERNKGLVSKAISKFGLELEDAIPAQEALQRSVQLFDPERGFQFSTYAMRAMINRLSRDKMLRKRQREVSLNNKIGEEAERINFIEDKSQRKSADIVEERDVEEGLKSGIRELLDPLNEREREVLIERFGLRRNERRTLEETGEIMGLTRERIRQIEKTALEKLSKDPRLERLRDYLD